MFFWSFDVFSEVWYRYADTIEECIAQANEEREDYEGMHGLNDVSSVFIGEIKTHVPHLDVDYVLEVLQDLAYDECGEGAEGWLYNVEDQAIKDLSDTLNEALYDWLERNELIPGFGSIINIREFDLSTKQEIKEDK